MALYGVKDNKCLQPIVERVGTSTSKILESSPYASNILQLDYPDGFTKNNCIPIAIGGIRGTDTWYFGYRRGNSIDENYCVKLTDSGIELYRKGDSGEDVESSATLYVYLMKWTD